MIASQCLIIKIICNDEAKRSHVTPLYDFTWMNKVLATVV